MSQDNFYSLIMGYGALTGLEQPGQVVDGNPIYVNNVLFSLAYNQETDPGNVFIYSDLGALPEKNHREVHQAMLSENLRFYADYGACLAVSPTNGHALLCLHLPLDRLTPDDLHERLQAVACVAEAWREQYLIEDIPTTGLDYPALAPRNTPLSGAIRERR